VRDFKPIVGDTWIADETVLKVGGRNVWFFDVIDEKTRYLLASRLTTSRATKEAALVMNEAKREAGKSPKRVITDKMGAYLDGIELVFGADTKHIQSKPFTDVNSTNVIERFHGTLKDRTKVVRGFKNMETARLLTQAWLVHYNFFKEHTTLGDIPPAVKMGTTPIKDWAEVISQTKTLPPIKPIPLLAMMAKPVSKTRHPKRRPVELRRKTYTQATLTTGRAIYADRKGERLSRKPHRGWRRIY
jgi:transposase-like protein